MARTALIDADVIHYSASAACQEDIVDDMGDVVTVAAAEYIWRHTVDSMIANIVKNSGATDYKLYLTGKGNFREEVAKKKPYKGNRKAKEKPLLFEDVATYLVDTYCAEVVTGMEADDAMAIAQCADLEGCYQEDPTVLDESLASTIICTTDKDLRMVPGWHYSWPVGDRIGERVPYFVDVLGSLQPKYHTDKFLKDGSPKLKKLEGVGLAWFYCQLIMGDSVDNIPGCPGAGPAKALAALEGLTTEEEMYQATLALYEAKYPENPSEELLEQAYLLWMVQEVDDQGEPIMWGGAA